MARLEDLDLTPGDGPGLRNEQEIQKAKDFLEEISELLGDRRFNFAHETLSGIWETVERTLRVTPGQYTAVRNIRRSVEEREERPRGGSRRYEGWSR